jgi:hypothetical protein
LTSVARIPISENLDKENHPLIWPGENPGLGSNQLDARDALADAEMINGLT